MSRSRSSAGRVRHLQGGGTAPGADVEHTCRVLRRGAEGRVDDIVHVNKIRAIPPAVRDRDVLPPTELARERRDHSPRSHASAVHRGHPEDRHWQAAAAPEVVGPHLAAELACQVVGGAMRGEERVLLRDHARLREVRVSRREVHELRDASRAGSLEQRWRPEN